MSLTIVTINHAKPKGKTYRLYDEKGLYLEVTKAGGKLWRLKYRFGGKEKRLAIGPYPEISLKDARAARDAARAQLAAGTDPSDYKKLMKATALSDSTNTFEAIAREWHSGQGRVWSPIHTKNVSDRLSRNVFSYLGNKTITHIIECSLCRVIVSS